MSSCSSGVVSGGLGDFEHKQSKLMIRSLGKVTVGYVNRFAGPNVNLDEVGCAAEEQDHPLRQLMFCQLFRTAYIIKGGAMKLESSNILTCFRCEALQSLDWESWVQQESWEREGIPILLRLNPGLHQVQEFMRVGFELEINMFLLYFSQALRGLTMEDVVDEAEAKQI